MNYKDMEWADGAVQLPGIMQIVFATRKNDIVTWPVLGNADATMGGAAKYIGNFGLAADATWKKVGVIVDESPVGSVSQGTKPSKTFLTTATFLHPGVEEEASGFARQANNDDLVYLIQQKNKKFRVVGNEMFQTETDIDQNLGGAVTDKMGTKLTVKISDVCPAPFYEGEIVTEDGIINESANKVAEVTFAPDGGIVVAGTDVVALTTATVGATIAYKLDTGNWVPYTVPIVTVGWAAGDHVITAKATKAGLTDSILTAKTFHV